MRVKRAAAIAAGVAAGTAAGAILTRRIVRRDRRRPDPVAGERLSELPSEDLGPVVADDGTILAVRAAGDPARPALVFAHGFSLDMTTWHYQWKAFSRAYRCVLFDHRGHGRSGVGEGGDYALKTLGGDLRAVLDATVPQGPAVLIGHSMGGMAILSFAEAYPEEFGSRVAGVVLADTAAAEIVRGALSGIVGRLHRIVTMRGRAARVRMYLRAGESDLAYIIARLINFGPKAPPSLVDYLASISGRAPVEVWGEALAGILAMDLRHTLEHMRVPSLVVVGDVDRLTPPASARALASALPDARLVVMEGAGHVAMMEQPRRFNAVLRRFLEEALEPAQPAAGRSGRG
jgi:pimeloyl-ACP methyl ester carboxylesterase